MTTPVHSQIEWTTMKAGDNCQEIYEGRVNGRLVALDIRA